MPWGRRVPRVRQVPGWVPVQVPGWVPVQVTGWVAVQEAVSVRAPEQQVPAADRWR